MITERYSGGQKVSSLLYLPKPRHMQEEGRLYYERNLMCLNADHYDVIATHMPQHTYLLKPKYILLLSGEGGDTSFYNLADPTKSYWLSITSDKLGLLKNSQQLNIDTLYLKFSSSFSDKETFTAELYKVSDLIRKFDVKHLIIEISTTEVVRGLLLDIQVKFNSTLTFIIRCDSQKEVPYYLGVKGVFKENQKTTTRFVMPDSQLLDTCNQYFYQDNAFTRFSKVLCTDDDIAYNVIYYHSHRKVNDAMSHVHKMNIMDYQKQIRSR